MSSDKPSYDELRERLAEAEVTLDSLRRGEVDLVIGTAQSLVVRFKSLGEENERMAREWQVTFDATNSAVWILDKDWRILQSNKTAERLRRAQPDLKVLFMSGYTDNAMVHRGVLDEGIPFTQKPFTVHDIAEKVRAVLGGRKSA